ncbi:MULTISPECIES: RsmB/NOP family class I SAM-dependent RNA methyltransferase [Candidatus Ichthyocystis]|uniref:RsmB/NOP family class I SAM-dependent RNA methyltransferase n=1 Tax=Candidatus Ichthyocystis TaxID=2929841 RepID=UPI000B820EC3|nr:MULTISPECIES: RsmB/NOP family class I SAM-dependent RNA methyltransferase [Ichthyocystis]
MTDYLVQLCSEPLFEALHNASSPADLLLENYLRNKHLGSRERSFISDLYYGVIRHKRSLSFLTGTQAPAILASYYSQIGSNRIERQQALWESPRLMKTEKAIRYDLPDWVLPILEKKMPSVDEQEAFVFSIHQPATTDIRVNTLKTNSNALKKYFLEKGYDIKQTSWSPTALRLPPMCVFNASADNRFQGGHFEIQDEGSQLVSHWCQPKRHELIVDLCGGSGGKSLALSSLMRSTGRIYAFDTARKRLGKIKPRILRSGATNITPILINNLNDDRLSKYNNKADRVLVDAPCSGSGTWRRRPYLKWKYLRNDIVNFQRTQLTILERAAYLVKDSGWLIYATCSFWSEENELIVDRFLLCHPEFTRISYSDWSMDVIEESQHIKDIQLYTHKHQTDCFFVSILCKKAKHNFI